MACVNGVAIADRTSAFSSGALFLLTQPVKHSGTIQPQLGTEVELRTGSAFLVARCGDCASAEQAFDTAHEISQKALDVLSAAGQRPMKIIDAHMEVLLWWRQGYRQILRAISVIPTGFETSGSGKVISSDGQIVPPAPEPNPGLLTAIACFANPRTLPVLRRARVSKAATTLFGYEFPGTLVPNELDERQFQTGFQLRNPGELMSIFRS